MLGLGPTELLILLVILAVIVVMVRVSKRPKKEPKPPSARGLSTPVPAELQSRIRDLAAADQRISAIKLLREATGLGLLDAKNAVDAIAAGRALPTPGVPRAPVADLADRARSLAGAGRGDEAVRLVAAETGMSAPEADAFVRALLP